jgi:cytoskeletal protein RodZ
MDRQSPKNTAHATDDTATGNVVAALERREQATSGGRSGTSGSSSGSKGLRTREDWMEQYDEDKPKKKKHRFLHFLGWLLLIAVLTGSIGGAAWYFFLRNEPKETAQNTQPAQAATDDTAKTAEEPTEVYNATAFNMQFNYPTDWKVTAGPNNTIVTTSPPTQLKLANGKTQTGQIVMTVQHKQTSLPEFTKGNALAVRESEKMDYGKPSQAQRASTYLSFLNYSQSTSKGIDGVYITGDFGYVKDQYIPQGDILKADPLITVTFRACKDSACTSVGDLATLATSTWDDKSFVKPIMTMLESIVVQ